MSIIYPFQQFPYAFPLTFGEVDGAIQIEDYDSVYFLQPTLNAHTAIVNMPSFFLQPDPGTLFEIVWFPGIGQQNQEIGMPIYDERFIGGDIPNQPYFELQLFDNIHFGPDGTDDFQGPDDFDLLEGPATFEVRTPE